MHLETPKECRTIFELVQGMAEQGQVISELRQETIPQILEDRHATEIAWMLHSIPADDVAYILGVLPEERAHEILPLMKAKDSQEVVNLMAYPKGTAGRIMTTEFLALPEDTTVHHHALLATSHQRRDCLFYLCDRSIRTVNRCGILTRTSCRVSHGAISKRACARRAQRHR